MTTHSPGRPADEADSIVAFWSSENPDLDPVTKALAIRLRWAAQVLERAIRRELAGIGVEMWELETLLVLRRSPDLRICAGALMRQTQVTSGAITNRLDRLEARGLITRATDPTDRRQVLVSLTEEGQAHTDRILTAKSDAEQGMFGGVDRSVVERLSDDLRAVLASQPGGD